MSLLTPVLFFSLKYECFAQLYVCATNLVSLKLSPETGVRNGCEPPCGGLGSLEEQPLERVSRPGI